MIEVVVGVIQDNWLLWTSIAATLFVALLTFVYWQYTHSGTLVSQKARVKPSRGGKVALLVGLMNSGKTSIFLRQLRHKTWADMGGKDAVLPSTKTSAEPNEAHVASSDGGNVLFVDLPGHPRLRHFMLDALEAHKNGRMTHVFFTLDSSGPVMTSDCRAVTESLYDVLNTLSSFAGPFHLTIVCNKADSPLALGQDKIKELLEQELNRLRRSKSTSVNDHSEDTFYLGIEGRPFVFEDVTDCMRMVQSCNFQTYAADSPPLL